jgi:hypothetical protein
LSEGLYIGGLEVVMVEGLEDGRVIYAPPGTSIKLLDGPTVVLESGSLLCNLATYATLEYSEAARAIVERDVIASLRVSAEGIEKADARRFRRNEKRLRDAQRSREGKDAEP